MTDRAGPWRIDDRSDSPPFEDLGSDAFRLRLEPNGCSAHTHIYHYHQVR
jgi:hypothetical protein